jgi:predicted nuclease with TOPRIM domain
MDSTLQLIVNIGAAATALAAVVGLPIALVKLWPVLKRGVSIGMSMEKLPEMALELRGLAQEQRSQGEILSEQTRSLATIVGEVEKVKQQVKNDHDSNLREDIDEVRDDVKSLHKNVGELHTKIDAHLNQPATTINVNGGTS